MNEIELAWVAGFFDGEGSAWISYPKSSKNGKRYPRLNVNITQTDTEILEWIRSEFNGRVQNKGDRRSTKPCYDLKLTARNARHFLRTVLPYLRLKKENVENLLDEEARLVVASP